MGRIKIVQSSKFKVQSLKKILKGKVAIVGVGNPLKGDDGAGPFFIQQLKNKGDGFIYYHTKRTKSKINEPVPFILIDAGEVPENYISPIVKTKPDVIMIVDAADFSGKPGEIEIFASKDISKIGFTTHTLSPAVFMEYLGQQTKARIFLLALQPKTIETGVDLSEEMKSSIEKLVDAITI